MPSRGIVTEIQRWSLNDGSGIRTTVFLKGCPLRCAWCHNPESHAASPELSYEAGKCLLCGECVSACPKGAIKLCAKQITINRNLCDACGICVGACAQKALSISGREMTAQEVLQAIERDSVFYRSSGGGVTFSGGEPTMQIGFLDSLLDECAARGINSAIETAMHFDWDSSWRVLEKADMIFADIKHMDSSLHEKWTGEGNETILENLMKLGRTGKKTLIRIPLVAGVNDTEKNIRETASFISCRLPMVEGVELLPYHKLGLGKYASLGKPFSQELERPSEKRMREIENAFRLGGINIISFK